MNVKYVYRLIYEFHGFKIDFMTHKQNHRKQKQREETYL